MGAKMNEIERVEAKQRFLELYAQRTVDQGVTQLCEDTGISFRTYQSWLRLDPAFVKKLAEVDQYRIHDAREIAVRHLEPVLMNIIDQAITGTRHAAKAAQLVFEIAGLKTNRGVKGGTNISIMNQVTAGGTDAETTTREAMLKRKKELEALLQAGDEAEILEEDGGS